MSDSGVFTPKPEIQGFRKVRKAAKNYRAYSSDLLGDADIRSYRHLPTEADPPRHTQLRAALMPVFAAEALAPHVPAFTDLARDLMAKVSSRGTAEVVADFVLPYVMGCLGIIYNRPQDVDEWVSWGPDVWTAEVHLAGDAITPETKRAERERNYTVKTQRSAKTLDDYLTRVIAEAQNPDASPREPRDLWEFLVDSEAGGEKLNHDELLGTGSVLLAGGRNTVIKLISGFIWHLVDNPEDREFMRANPDARSAAVAEMARYLSPLPKIERLEVAAEPGGEDRLVLLSFVSGNFDDTEFEDPETLDIRREEKPNLAFGFSRHSCLGLQITRHETVAFLDAFLSDWPNWTFDGEPVIEWAKEQVGDQTVTIIDSFTAIPVVTR